MIQDLIKMFVSAPWYMQVILSVYALAAVVIVALMANGVYKSNKEA